MASRPHRSALRSQSSPLSHAFLGVGLEVREFALANGLRVILAPQAHSPVVSIQTWVPAGSGCDPARLSGLAHLVEHLTYLNTPGEEDYDIAVDTLGGESNATTWTDWTHFHLSVPASGRRQALRLEASRFAALTVSEPSFSREKRVVEAERLQRVEGDLEAWVSETLYMQAFRRHPYRFPTVGTAQAIRGLTAAHCRAFFAEHYRADRLCLILAGHCGDAKVMAEILDSFGQLPRAQASAPGVLKRAPHANNPEAKQRRARHLSVAYPGRYSALSVGWKCPPVTHPDWPALALLTEALSGEGARALPEALSAVLGSCIQFSVELTPFAHAGLLEVFVSFQRPFKQRLLPEVALQAELIRAARKLNETDLERARLQVALRAQVSLESAHGRATELGFSATLFGSFAGLNEKLAGYPRETLASLNGAAERYLKTSGRTAVHASPSANLKPELPRAAKARPRKVAETDRHRSENAA